MKICHLTSCFPPSRGGVETYVYNLCRGLVERGHQVKVITSSRGKPPGKYHEWIDGIEVIRYPERLHFLEAPILPLIAFHALFEDYDILNIHNMIPTISELALIFGRCRRKPIVLTYYNDTETQQYGVLGRFATKAYAKIARSIAQLADQIVALNKAYAETSPVLSSVLDRIAIIPCGVDLNKFTPLQTSSEDNDLSRINKSHIILYVGKLIWYKGIEYLIQAMKTVLENVDDAQLIIVGDGPERSKLAALANELGVGEHVTFTGWVPDESLPKYYQIADLLVLPSISRREAFGIVLLEAMACGKPVIVSDIPGPNMVIKNNENGLIVPPKNVLRLAEAIIGLLVDEDRRKEMGAHSRKLVEAKYDWDNIVERYEAIYSEIYSRIHGNLTK